MVERIMDTKLGVRYIEHIMSLIPHRYPMLLVDRILEITPNQGAVALKNVTINEPYFNGHFPGKPIMPGVLIIEALAQAAAAFVAAEFAEDDDRQKLIYFMSIESARFRKPVVPGDSLYLHVALIKRRGSIWKIKGEARVNSERVADAEFTAMTVDNKAE
jgi:3-hydroxyacyl-[acyl-carrier-protein] dehydratase